MSRSVQYLPQGADQETARSDFGERLRIRITQRGWNQSELARRAGVKRDRVSNYVRGNTWPDPSNLSKICKALKCAPEDLIPSIGIAEPEPVPVSVTSEGTMIHLRVSKRVSLSKASRILAILEEPDGPEDEPGAVPEPKPAARSRKKPARKTTANRRR